MVGKVEVVLYNNKVHYRLTVKRNITVLRGDSATGKSELIRLLTLYNSNPKSSGITLICERECSVLNEGNWELFLRTYSRDRCISANGKSRIKRLLLEHADQAVLAIVDGAAFGPEMQECMEIADACGSSMALFAPESFEYLILESGLIEVPKAILEETWNHADSVRYFSWEEFYTSYLTDISRNQVYQYSKHRLNHFYKTLGSVEKISRVLPDTIQGIADEMDTLMKEGPKP